MGNRLKKSELQVKSDFSSKSDLSAEDCAAIAKQYEYYMALIKLRKRGATRLGKLPNGVFRRILEYCEPKITTRVTDHQYEGRKLPINYTWPEKVSYKNPINGVLGFQNDDIGIGWFKFKFELKSREQTDDDPWYNDFSYLDWSEITTIDISYYSIYSRVVGFEFYNQNNK